MRLLLESLIISSEIRSKVMAYINQPRTPKVMVDCDVFKRTEFSPFKFTANIFEQRVDEALNYVYANKVSGHESYIQIAKDIPKFLDSDIDESMTFYIVIENNWDFVMITLEEMGDDDDAFTEYGMGLYFTGESDNAIKLLNTLGIDIVKALDGTLTNPKRPPTGYDHSLSVVENVLKVCCPLRETPEPIVDLFERLLNKNDFDEVVLSDEELKSITFEDIWFPIKGSGYYGIVYRNYLDESQTYILTVSNDHTAIHFAGIASSNTNGEYSIKQNPMVMYTINRSVITELR